MWPYFPSGASSLLMKETLFGERLSLASLERRQEDGALESSREISGLDFGKRS